MKALIETIVYPLVDHPDQIEVTVEETDEKIRYHLTVHSDDVGKVIGKMVGLQKRFVRLSMQRVPIQTKEST